MFASTLCFVLIMVLFWLCAKLRAAQAHTIRLNKENENLHQSLIQTKFTLRNTTEELAKSNDKNQTKPKQTDDVTNSVLYTSLSLQHANLQEKYSKLHEKYTLCLWEIDRLEELKDVKQSEPNAQIYEDFSDDCGVSDNGVS